MPLTTQSDELKLVESIVSANPSGLEIAAVEVEMARRLGNKPNRLTLQRRLHKFIDEQPT